MAQDFTREISRREALIAAAGGVAAALTAGAPAEARGGDRDRDRLRGPRRLRQARRRQSGPARRARLQRPGGRGHRRRRALPFAAARRGFDLRHQAGRLHAAGRPRDRPAALLSPASARAARPPRSISTFAGIAPTGPLPASVDFALKRQDEPERLRGRAVHRPAAGDGRRGRLHPRGRDRGAGGREGAVRPHRRRHHVRRSLALRPLQPRSSARSACRGGTSAATTTSTSRRPTGATAAKPTSASSARTITPSPTRRRCS